MSDSAWKAKLKAEHIFVVARLDKFHGGELWPK